MIKRLLSPMLFAFAWFAAEPPTLPAPDLYQIDVVPTGGLRLHFSVTNPLQVDAFKVQRWHGDGARQTFTVNPSKLIRQSIVNRQGETFLWTDTNAAESVTVIYRVRSVVGSEKSTWSNQLACELPKSTRH